MPASSYRLVLQCDRKVRLDEHWPSLANIALISLIGLSLRTLVEVLIDPFSSKGLHSFGITLIRFDNAASTRTLQTPARVTLDFISPPLLLIWETGVPFARCCPDHVHAR